MRILAVSDVHGSKGASKTINNQVQKSSPHVVLVCGDITQFGPPSWATEFLNSICVRTLAIPGNCDPEGVISAIQESKATCLHGRKEKIEGITFCGFGGSNPTPFQTPLEFTEDEIYSKLEGIATPRCILAVHAPAKGHLDRTSSVSDLGSAAISDIVKKFSPRLVVSAHIHEARGHEVEGQITFVNPGPASKGYAAIIDIDEKITVKLIQG